MKVWIVFTGREDFGEDTIAWLRDAGDDNMPKDGGERYAIFDNRADAENFCAKLKQSRGIIRYDWAYVREFEVWGNSEYKTLEQQIAELWDSRGMEVLRETVEPLAGGKASWQIVAKQKGEGAGMTPITCPSCGSSRVMATERGKAACRRCGRIFRPEAARE